MSRPLKAVVLDNDETTGSYAIVFVVLSILQKMENLTDKYIEAILQRLASWMFRFNVFRPGLKSLLTNLIYMKKMKMIDSIVMYTNQTELEPCDLTNFQSLIWSPPRTIAFMMNTLVDENIFDHILARPPAFNSVGNQPIPKSFSRVLQLYPAAPKDITEMVFVDDYAHAEFILANDIPMNKRDSSAWYRISPYKKILDWEQFYACLNFCFQSVDFVNDLFFVSFEKYESMRPKEATRESSKPLFNLTTFLINKFFEEV